MEIKGNSQTNMANRLTWYINSIAITPSAFATKAGIDISGFHKMLKGQQTITAGTLKKIALTYNINYTWLLTGEGEMLKSDTKSSTDVAADASVIPLLPIAAHGGSLNDFVVSVRDSDCEKVVSPVKGADFALPVAGDSMAPEYPNGSQVHVKRINERAFIEWGKVYVLDTCNGTVIKRITPSDREGFIRCVSINPNPIYAAFEVSLNDIYGIYRVVLCLSVK